MPSFLTHLLYYKDLFVSFSILFLGRFLPRQNPTHKDLSNKTAIVTGANSGIGYEISLALAKQGAAVHLACRNDAKCEEAVQKIVSHVPGAEERVHGLHLDIGDLDSVREFARAWIEARKGNVDILVHNAGIGAPANAFQSASAEEQGDGGVLDLLYRTNFLGSFLLTYLLESHLADTARVVLTSSTGQYAGSSSLLTTPKAVNAQYSNTKAMQCCFAKLLQRHFDSQFAASDGKVRRIAHAFTPGFTSTPILEKMSRKDVKWSTEGPFRLLLATTQLATDVDQGAITGWWLCSTDERKVVGKGNGGRYWDRMTERRSKADVISEPALQTLWKGWERDSAVEWRAF